MKLFITNKESFEASCAQSKLAHQNAYSQLLNATSDGNIPIEILTMDCLFKFVQIKEEVYFYKFLGTV